MQGGEAPPSVLGAPSGAREEVKNRNGDAPVPFSWLPAEERNGQSIMSQSIIHKDGFLSAALEREALPTTSVLLRGLREPLPSAFSASGTLWRGNADASFRGNRAAEEEQDLLSGTGRTSYCSFWLIKIMNWFWQVMNRLFHHPSATYWCGATFG